MTTLAEAYKWDLTRKFKEQLSLEGDTPDACEALFELKGIVLKTLLGTALNELLASLESQQAGKKNPEAKAVSQGIVETVVKDIAMALTGKEWEPKGHKEKASP